MDSAVRRALLRRLAILQLREAYQNINTPPEVIMEIEDITQKLEGSTELPDLSDPEPRDKDNKLSSDYIPEMVLVLKNLQDKSTPIVICLVNALLIAARVKNRQLEFHCYHELTSWKDVEFEKLPKYRIVHGYYYDLSNGIRKVYYALLGQSQQSCDVVIRDSVHQIISLILENKIRNQAMEDMSSKSRELNLLFGKPSVEISRTWEDIVSKPNIPAESVKVHTYLSLYESVLDGARYSLANLLLSALETQING